MRFWLLLLVLGAGWGLTQPFSKLVVSAGYRGFGIIFWQSVIGILLLAGLSLARGKWLPLGRAQIRVYVIIAVLGTVVPNLVSYTTYRFLDAGIMSILISMVPIFAFPIALLMGNDQMKLLRLVGLLIGFTGAMFLILPGQAAIGQVSVLWVLVGLIPSLLYAFEGNWVARFGTAGLDPMQVIFGASIVGALVSGPLALMNATWINPLTPWGVPDYALVASSVIHTIVYASYVWLLGAAGPVFTVQVGYVVTLSGVFWARLLLGESYSGWVWAALVLVLTGVFLVQPKPKLALVPDGAEGQN